MTDHGPGGAAPEAEPEPTLTLTEALKLSGLADTGGQAKRLVQDGEVRVNGEVETRRKRRLHPGDEIRVGEETFVLELEEEADVELPADDEPHAGNA